MGSALQRVLWYCAVASCVRAWTDGGARLVGDCSYDSHVPLPPYPQNLTSGTWMTPDDSTRYVWWHQLFIIIPTNASKAHPDVASVRRRREAAGPWAGARR